MSALCNSLLVYIFAQEDDGDKLDFLITYSYQGSTKKVREEQQEGLFGSYFKCKYKRIKSKMHLLKGNNYSSYWYYK